jgi:hypothetical protein
MKNERKKNFSDRINPAAFTLRTEVSQTLWDKVLRCYEEKQVY